MSSQPTATAASAPPSLSAEVVFIDWSGRAAWRRGSGIPSDCERQSASGKHWHYVEHGAQHVSGDVERSTPSNIYIILNATHAEVTVTAITAAVALAPSAFPIGVMSAKIAAMSPEVRASFCCCDGMAR